MEKKIGTKHIYNRFALIILAMTLICTAFGCSGNNDTKMPENSVLKVGDNYISEEFLDEFTIFMLSLYAITQMVDYDTNVDDLVIADAKPSVLDMIAETESLRVHYKDWSDVIPDLTEELASFKENVFLTEGLSERFNAQGVTDASFLYYLETNYLHEANRMEATDNGAYPTEADIENYYYSNPDYFNVPERRQSSHILFEDADLKGETRALAEEIHDKIISGEVSFEAMASEYNTDGTNETGGDLGFASPGDFVPEFEDVLFSMNVDEISDIVETPYGFHIIKLTDIEEGRVMTLEEVKEDISSYLSNLRESEYAQEIVASTVVEYLSDLYPSPDNRNVSVD